MPYSTNSHSTMYNYNNAVMLCVTGGYAQPEIGEHTLEILKELKYSDSRIRELVEGRTVHQSDKRAKL